MRKNTGCQQNERNGLSFAHRFWFQFCAVALALYTAYVVCLSKSSLFEGTAATLCSLLVFVLIAAGLYGLLLFVCKKLAALALHAAGRAVDTFRLLLICVNGSSVVVCSTFLSS